MLRGGKHPSPKLQEAWDREEVQFAVLERAPAPSDLPSLEDWWMKQFPELLNLLEAAGVFHQHSQQSKDLMSEIALRRFKCTY